MRQVRVGIGAAALWAAAVGSGGTSVCVCVGVRESALVCLWHALRIEQCGAHT